MAKSVWNSFIVDSEGNTLAGASVEVRLESSGALATLYADSVGSGLGNPFVTGADGKATFYADGSINGYKVTATHASLTSPAEFRNEPVGEAKNYDIGTDSGNLITVGAADARYAVLAQNKTDATVAPTVTNDSSEGYSISSRWFDVTANEVYVCIDPAVGAAVWVQTSLTTDELGSMATRNEGSAGTEHRTNTDNEATFLAKPLTVTEIAGTTYTVTAADNGTMLKTTNASAVTITVPEVSTEDLDNGFQVIVQRGGDGVVTIAKEGADVLNAADDFYDIDVKYGAASVVKEADGVWWMTGALANDPILTGYTAPTGTADRSGYVTYPATTIGVIYTPAEMQAISDSLTELSEHVKALIDDLTA